MIAGFAANSNPWWDTCAIDYYAIGLPVVLWHMHRERMPMGDAPKARAFLLVVLVLAMLWPFLLLGICANYILERGDKPRAKKHADRSATERWEMPDK